MSKFELEKIKELINSYGRYIICDEIWENDYTELLDASGKAWVWEECEDVLNSGAIGEYEGKTIVQHQANYKNVQEILENEAFILFDDDNVYYGDDATACDWKRDTVGEIVDEFCESDVYDNTEVAEIIQRYLQAEIDDLRSDDMESKLIHYMLNNPDDADVQNKMIEIVSGLDYVVRADDLKEITELMGVDDVLESVANSGVKPSDADGVVMMFGESKEIISFDECDAVEVLMNEVLPELGLDIEDALELHISGWGASVFEICADLGISKVDLIEFYEENQ